MKVLSSLVLMVLFVETVKVSGNQPIDPTPVQPVVALQSVVAPKLACCEIPPCPPSCPTPPGERK